MLRIRETEGPSRATAVQSGCSTDGHGSRYSRCTQATGPAARGIASQALISQELWLSEDAMQWRVIRTGNRISALCAGKSDHCQALEYGSEQKERSKQ